MNGVFGNKKRANMSEIDKQVETMPPSPQSVSSNSNANYRGASFGWSALWVFAAVVVITALLWLVQPSNLGCSEGMGYLFLMVLVPSAMCVPIVGLAVASLIRQERPRWPAIVGLVLSVGPAAVALYILSTIQW